MRYSLVCILGVFYASLLGQTQITFQVKGITPKKQEKIGIRGSFAPLNWEKSIPMDLTDQVYTKTLTFDQVGEILEFKFVLFNNDNHPEWETNPNRIIILMPDTSIISNHIFNREQILDPKTLPLLSVPELQEDFELIRIMVLDVHPGTLRYRTREEIEEELARLKQALSQPQTHGQAYLAMSRMTAVIQCDHTKVGFNNQNNIINSIIHYQKDKLPFTFRWIDNQMVVLQNASNDSALVRGTAVVSINGIPVEDIRDRMIHYVAADGATDQNRLYKMEVNGYDFRYNAFDVFYPLLYPVQDDTLRLEVIQPNSSKEVIHVVCQSRDERSAILEQRYDDFPKTRDDLWDFEVVDDSIGILTINSFGLHGWKAMTLDYKAFLKEVFRELAASNIPHLILDIRENNGGADEMAIELYSYLVEKAKPLQREGRTRYISFPDELKPFVQTWGDEPWYHELKPDNAKPQDGYYIFREKERIEKSDKPIYKGKVYLLAGAANTSLAYYTTNRFRLENLGPIIGQETGGNLNDINGGNILFLRLPNSKIEIDFPVMGSFSLSPQPNQGIVPNFQIEWTKQDILDRRDLEMEKVLELIRDNSNYSNK